MGKASKKAPRKRSSKAKSAAHTPARIAPTAHNRAASTHAARSVTRARPPSPIAENRAVSATPNDRLAPGPAASSARLVVAIPKGRVLGPLSARLAALGVDRNVLLADDRTLVRDDPTTGLRFLLLKPDDVPTYVEYGAADLGIVGRDVLLEREYDLYAPLDLGIGVCRMVVAGKPQTHPPGRTLRVATKFQNIASRYFLGKGQQVDLVYVQGSVELAPLTGLADVIVDLVESGETLRQNGLVELEVICPISSVVIANRVALKLKRASIGPLLRGLRA